MPTHKRLVGAAKGGPSRTYLVSTRYVQNCNDRNFYDLCEFKFYDFNYGLDQI